jgi:integrase
MTIKRYTGIQTDEVRNLHLADPDLAFHEMSAPVALSDEEINRILSRSQDDPKYRDLHDVALITLDTGIRASELRELRWADVDLERVRITIRQAKSDHVRRATFGKDTVRILESRRERDPESDFVLGRSPRSVLHRVMHQLSLLCKQIGVGRVNLRAFRHAAIVRHREY